MLLAPGHGWIADPAGPEQNYAILGGTSTNPLGVGQELVTVDQEEVVDCPAHLSSAEAAALPLTGLTAWRALVTKSGAATAVRLPHDCFGDEMTKVRPGKSTCG